MQKFSRAVQRFYCYGIDLNNPVDRVREGYFPVLENVRSRQAGSIERRAGMTAVCTPHASQFPIHSIKRLVDGFYGNESLVVGTGTKLTYGATPTNTAQYAGVDVALSGYPLNMIPWRPDQSTNAWLYLGDSSVLYKIRRDGTVHPIGVAPPTQPPTVELKGFTSGSYLNFQTLAQWGGGAGVTYDNTVVTTVPTAPVRIPAALTTTRAVYDNLVGGLGWASVVLPATAMAVLGVGSLIDITVGATTYTYPIHEIYPQSAQVSIANIIYDSGATGLCTIQATQPVKELRRNAVVLLDIGGANRYARIISTTEGPDGTISFRCNTEADTILIGDLIQVQGTIRIYDGIAAGLTLAGGNAIAQNCITSGGAGTAGVKTGWIQTLQAIDLSKITTTTPWGSGVQTTAIGDDYLHLAFKFSDLSRLVQCRIMFNCDTSTAGADIFTKNFYYRSFTANDLTAAAKATQTALDARSGAIAREKIDNPPAAVPSPVVLGRDFRRREGARVQDPEFNPGNIVDPVRGTPTIDDPNAPYVPGEGSSRSQTGTGDNQWHEIRFRISDLIRVGTDSSRGLADINAFRLEITVNDTTAFTFSINSLTAWGTSPLDTTAITTPYFYRYRYRVSTTGAVSNWSPAPLYGVQPMRGQTEVQFTAPSVTEADYIDIQRFGGLLNQWTYIGTVPASTPIFNDKLSDESIVANAPFSDDDEHYKPWLIIGARVTGTTTVSGVAGTIIQNAAATFNTSWAKGTTIIVNGVSTTIRRVLSTTLLEVADSLNYQTAAVSWEVPEPYLANQPLGPMWMWRGRMFACGDNTNPGTLYWARENDPDSTEEGFRLEITAPSEPLMMGCEFNDRNYVFSSENMFEIVQTGPNSFVAQKIPGGKGLWGRWALCVADRIYFLGKDGIYQTTGGEAVSITDATIRPLFPRNGVFGSTTNGFFPLDMKDGDTALNGYALKSSSWFRLSYFQGKLYFVYVDTTGIFRAMHYNTQAEQPGWFPEIYTPRAVCFYGDESKHFSGVNTRLFIGGSDTPGGQLYSSSETAFDGATVINWQVRTPSFDASNPRAEKRWGDFIVDTLGAGTISVSAAVDNHSTAIVISPLTIGASVTRAQTKFDIASGNGAEGRNLSILLQGNTLSDTLYLWEMSYADRPEDTIKRATEQDDLGLLQPKHFRGLIIEADTDALAKTVEIVADGVVVATLSVNHNGRLEKPYSFTEFDAYQISLRPTDNNNWKLFNYHWIFDPYPDNAAIPPAWTNDGNPGAKYLYGVIVEADTASANLNVAVKYDTLTAAGGAIATTTTPTVTQQHNGRTTLAYHITNPVICHLMQLVPAAAMRIFSIKWLWDPWPEYSRFILDYNDLGVPGPKFFQGVNIEADTRDPAGVAQNVDVRVMIDGTLVTTFTLNHDGRRRKPYVFPAAAIGTNIQLVPQADLRVFKVDWVWEPEPELTTRWESQQTSHGLRGYQHYREAFITLLSTAAVTMTITRAEDGTVYTYNIPSTGGLRKKTYIPLGAIKGKGFIYTFTSASGFRLYKDDCEMRIKPWGSQEQFAPHAPFGGDHGNGASRI